MKAMAMTELYRNEAPCGCGNAEGLLEDGAHYFDEWMCPEHTIIAYKNLRQHMEEHEQALKQEG